MTLHTFVGQVHEKGGADVNAGDKVLVREHRYFVEALKNDDPREISETGVVHEEEGILFSTFELPLSLGRCGSETDDTTVWGEWVQCDQMGHGNNNAHASGPRLQSTCFAPLEAMMISSSISPSSGG